MLNHCGVCRSNGADLISLKFKEESQRILHKLKDFIPANIVNSMRNICQTCVKELDIAYSFKLRCDQLNYEGPKITSKRALCEICGQTFKHLASLEQHCSHGRRIVPVDQMHGKKQPKNRGETPKRKRNIEHRIARDSLKFRISVKNGKITPMTRSEKMDKALMDLN